MSLDLKDKNLEKMMKWLQTKPALDDLGAEYPELREAVRQEITEIVAHGNAAELAAYLKRMSQGEKTLEKRYIGSRGEKKIAEALVLQAVRSRMAHLSVKQHLISEATGIVKGKVRFNLLNGYLAQRLLFAEGLVRKPVSLFWFRVVWPLLWQRRLLMPLVQPQGI
jgi:hypothetical protein